MDILSALKSEASKLQHQLDGLNSAIKALGGRNSVSNGRRRKRHVSAAARAKMAASQKGEVGENKTREAEYFGVVGSGGCFGFCCPPCAYSPCAPDNGRQNG